MKKLLPIILIGIMMSSCQKEVRTDYIIEGTAKDVYNGIRVYLNELDQRGRPVPVDTAIVLNGSFTFNGKVPYPKLYFLTMNGSPGRIPLMIENTKMTLDVDKKILSNSILSGSDSHDLLHEFNTTLNKIKEDLNTVSKNYSDAQFLRDSVNMKSDKVVLEKLQEKLANYPFDFIEEHSNSNTVLEIFQSQLRVANADYPKIKTLFDNLDQSVKITQKGITIKSIIEQTIAKIEAQKNTAIGAIAPPFSAPDPEGKELAISEVYSKGKITIIDFWAAWCGPCRRENPNLVKIYDQYHDKGLEIIGVSLDGRRGQQNPKEAWIKAIEDDKLTWNHVSNLTYFDKIAQSYNVNAIPAMFILDDKGAIIAKNLRGKALELKVAELLN
ncbi:TlpA disulfide reductase family protein [Winogradskyella immobilis]|uniref:AhpC/TSA family protein n=1 Tax=Winogradskyella immobilis TaxID=2816852 RepID=A0ABS8EN37_9FLAO|nr:TlpA disulfide reductase family protein [Winogradskyella immobilis]MCC1484558.1 AhpC/TSA family protein [Winogradskyella immobilis]MCG0016650.1 AhpC/TSA family protein [Winogradskyella immobilis]